ncbi:MAG TPA: acyl-CoA dehydrogenase [Candidatus Binatia bacterium]|nr:acyl-CoA dehydrogenase [Candidatus Binatia bacterium]
MDFNFTPEEEAFRRDLRTWLRQNLPEGYDPQKFDEIDADARFEFQRAWQKKAHAAGWVGIHWPKEYGGRGASLMEMFIFNQEMNKARAPRYANTLGLMMSGPTIIHWGTEEQKRRYLPKILSGEEIWCEGLSEPNAGSDLASMQTRAVEDGDYFVINGQKVWTSYAHRADYIQLFVRTDPNTAKHKGISCLIVDLKTPGVTVRPLVQITGDAEFNEVFFEDARVPRTNLLGPRDEGWKVLVTTLMHERAGIGAELPVHRQLTELLRLSKTVEVNGKPASEDAAVRQKLAQFAIECRAVTYNMFRSFSKRLKGNPPGPEGSINKLVGSELNLRMAAFATELLGPYAQLTQGSAYAVDHGRWPRAALWGRLLTIGGGTSEIQRGILGDRVLGLPKG